MTITQAIKILSQAALAYANGCDKERVEKIKRAVTRLDPHIKNGILVHHAGKIITTEEVKELMP